MKFRIPCFIRGSSHGISVVPLEASVATLVPFYARRSLPDGDDAGRHGARDTLCSVASEPPRQSRHGKLAIPLPFEDAIRAALEVKPPPKPPKQKPQAKKKAKP